MTATSLLLLLTWLSVNVPFTSSLPDLLLHALEEHRPCRPLKRNLDKLRQNENAPFSRSGQSETSGSQFITVEGSETPLFLCEGTQRCRTTILRQQDKIVSEIESKYPGAKLIARTHKLVNAVFMEIPKYSNPEISSIRWMDGVTRISPQVIFYPYLNVTTEYIGAKYANEEYCTTGKGIKVAVLDTGIDYTHEALGGPGTVLAYKRAYGRNKRSRENTQRDGLFPTERVYDGFDFLGDTFDGTSVTSGTQDNDPIDSEGGHGTLVSSTIAAVAPDVQLLAVKVCTSQLDVGCPDFAILKGIEFALDPNGDDSTDDKVDIINLSIGVPFLSSFYDPISLALENAFALGVLTVIAFGNAGNEPYIAGSTSITPNAIACAATGHPNSTTSGIIEPYSARGPGENNLLKPDLSAPSGSLAAVSGTGNGYARVRGTSFSAPIVAGAAALLKEKCRDCSPLAIKAILMNTAYRNVKYDASGDIPAPLTLGGSGEVRVRDALEADFWAYSPDEGDVQPSLSLGLINAAHDIVIRRTVKVTNISNKSQTLSIRAAFRDPEDEATGAVVIAFHPSEVFLSSCDATVSFDVYFNITAAKAPNNFMGSGGGLGSDPTALDKNEFDGHILIQSVETGKEIGLPFHMLLRKAAELNISNQSLPWNSEVPTSTNIAMVNKGAGTAQIDAYNLIALSQDDSEPPIGTYEQRVDLRAMGYRTLDVGEPDCSFLLEFAVSLWERPRHLVPIIIAVIIDNNGDSVEDYILFTDFARDVDCALIDVEANMTRCTGFPADHGTNTGNVILRVCAESVGLTHSQSMNVAFGVLAPPFDTFADDAGFFEIPFPDTRLSASSYDIGPNEALMDFNVNDSAIGYSPFHPFPKGLQLITNAYRSENSTGAATWETEVVLLVREGVIPPKERTPDILDFPSARSANGPKCHWHDDACLFPTQTPTISHETTFPTEAFTLSPTESPAPSSSNEPTTQPSNEPECEPNIVPRSRVRTVAPRPSSVSGSNIVTGSYTLAITAILSAVTCL